MDTRDARILMKALDLLIENANVPLRISHDYCDADLHGPVAKLCAEIVGEVDVTIRSRIFREFPEMKGNDI